MNLFRRPSVRYGQTPAPETPYQKAAQAWDERIGSARVQAGNWRLIAFGNLLLAAGLAAGLVWQSAPRPAGAPGGGGDQTRGEPAGRARPCPPHTPTPPLSPRV